MNEKTVMDALVQMKRTGNLLNELWDLTQQLGQAIDRNDQVSTQMLIAMREEPLGKLQAADQAVREQLEPMEAMLREGCVGQLPEIYDGGDPGPSKGCFAQAWSVGELLRVYEKLEEIEEKRHAG